MIPKLLVELGWSAAYQDQITAEDAALAPARVTALHRDRVQAMAAEGPIELLCPPSLPVSAMAVGDWLLHDAVRVSRVLDRQSILQRRAPGTGAETQLIEIGRAHV